MRIAERLPQIADYAFWICKRSDGLQADSAVTSGRHMSLTVGTSKDLRKLRICGSV